MTERSGRSRRSRRAASSAWDRRWNGDPSKVARGGPAAVLAHQPAIIDEHAQQFLDEQRVAVGGLSDPAPDLDIEVRTTEETHDELVGLGHAERFELDRRRRQFAAAPRRPHLQELLAADAQQKDRRFARPVGDVLDQVEQARLRPVHVVEDEDQRPLMGQGREQPTDRPEGVVRIGSALRQADRLGDPVEDAARIGLLVGRQHGGELGVRVGLGVVITDTGRREQHLPDRPKGDAPPVR